MPPATRSQTAATRKTGATSNAPPQLALDLSDQDFAFSNGEDDNIAWSSGMRMRQEASTQFGPAHDTDAASTSSNRSNNSKAPRSQAKQPDGPPCFTIDLSLPPEQRYLAVCAAFQPELAELVPLFDEVVGGMLHWVPLKLLRAICRFVLRGIYDWEENRELKGISEATGVQMYLLVAFNVLLDLFMGCSSGGATVRADGDGKGRGSKMLHFRTLDWGMPSLRKVVVQLDFVLRNDGPVVARSITYAGYVGVLTGVREGLSMSLNFRPNRVDNGVWVADAKYVWHLVCVLLGWRRSISSTLRGYLLPRAQRHGWWLFRKGTLGTMEDLLDCQAIIKQIGGDKEHSKRPIKTTACYLTFCNGIETTVIERDRISAKARSGDEFVVVTNTDETPPGAPETQQQTASEKAANITTTGEAPAPLSELQEIIAEAQDRQECALHNWRNLQTSRARQLNLQHITGEERKRLARVEDLVELVQKYPTTNECTHFATVMDPQEGSVVWCQRWKEPVGTRWIREHMSRRR